MFGNAVVYMSICENSWQRVKEMLVKVDNCGLNIVLYQNQARLHDKNEKLLEYFNSLHAFQCVSYLLMCTDEDCVDFIYTTASNFSEVANSLIGNFWIICSPLPIFISSVMDIKTVFS